MAHNAQFGPLILFWYPPLTNYSPVFLTQWLNSNVPAVEKFIHNILYTALALVMTLDKLPNKNDVRHLKKTAYTGRNTIMYWNIQQITGKVTALRMSQNYAFSILHATMMYFIFFSVMKSPRTDYVIAKKWYFVNDGNCICFTVKKTVWTFSSCVFTAVVIIAILKSLKCRTIASPLFVLIWQIAALVRQCF